MTKPQASLTWRCGYRVPLPHRHHDLLLSQKLAHLDTRQIPKGSSFDTLSLHSRVCSSSHAAPSPHFQSRPIRITSQGIKANSWILGSLLTCIWLWAQTLHTCEWQSHYIKCWTYFEIVKKEDCAQTWEAKEAAAVSKLLIANSMLLASLITGFPSKNLWNRKGGSMCMALVKPATHLCFPTCILEHHCSLIHPLACCKVVVFCSQSYEIQVGCKFEVLQGLESRWERHKGDVEHEATNNSPQAYCLPPTTSGSFACCPQPPPHSSPQ